MATDQLTDEEIIEQLAELYQRDERQPHKEKLLFQEIFRRYSQQAMKLCRYHGLSRDDANDAIQDTFFNLYLYATKFQKGKIFKPYFFKILYNNICNKYNELKKFKVKDITDAEELTSECGPEKNIFEKLHKREDFLHIINKMPKKFKDVIIYKVFCDLDMETISNLMNLQRRQLYNVLDQALEILRDKLGADYETE